MLMKKNSTPVLGFLAVSALSVVFSQGCGSSDASDGIASEITASAVSGAASSSEGSLASYEVGKSHSSLASSIADSILDGSFFLQKANATSCLVALAGATCSGSTLTIPLGAVGSGCTILGSTWSGNQIITFSTGTCLAAFGNAGANAVFTRTTDAAGLVRADKSGKTVTITTADSSGFDTAKTGGAQVTCGASGCASARTVTIKGVHYVGSGGIAWDHTVSTDTDLSITGKGATRVINSGVVRVQHNLAKFKSIATINGPLTHDATCCFPLSGSITSAFSGGKLDGKSETITFSATCGSATLTDSKGTQSPLTLSHCL
jgi:hypothetical protein